MPGEEHPLRTRTVAFRGPPRPVSRAFGRRAYSEGAPALSHSRPRDEQDQKLRHDSTTRQRSASLTATQKSALLTVDFSTQTNTRSLQVHEGSRHAALQSEIHQAELYRNSLPSLVWHLRKLYHAQHRVSDIRKRHDEAQSRTLDFQTRLRESIGKLFAVIPELLPNVKQAVEGDGEGEGAKKHDERFSNYSSTGDTDSVPIAALRPTDHAQALYASDPGRRWPAVSISPRELQNRYFEYLQHHEDARVQEEAMQPLRVELAYEEFKLKNRHEEFEEALGSVTGDLPELKMASSFATSSETTSAPTAASRASSHGTDPALLKALWEYKRRVAVLKDRRLEFGFHHREGLAGRDLMVDQGETLIPTDDEYNQIYEDQLRDVDAELQECEAELRDITIRCQQEGLDTAKAEKLTTSSNAMVEPTESSIISASEEKGNLISRPPLLNVSSSHPGLEATSRDTHNDQVKTWLDQLEPSSPPDAAFSSGRQRITLAPQLETAEASTPGLTASQTLSRRHSMGSVSSRAFESRSMSRPDANEPGSDPPNPTDRQLTLPPGMHDARILQKSDPAIIAFPGYTALTFDSQQGGKYFRIGTVVEILWAEPSSYTTLITQSPRDTGNLPTRKFVLVTDLEKPFAVIPILTYDERGIVGAGGRLSDHGIIYTGSQVPKLHPSELPKNTSPGDFETLRAPAIRVIPKNPQDTLDPGSRVNFGRLYQLDPTDIAVSVYGHVHPDSLGNFQSIYRDVRRKRNAEAKSTARSLSPASVASQNPAQQLINLRVRAQNMRVELSQLTQQEQVALSKLPVDRQREDLLRVLQTQSPSLYAAVSKVVGTQRR